MHTQVCRLLQLYDAITCSDMQKTIIKIALWGEEGGGDNVCQYSSYCSLCVQCLVQKHGDHIGAANIFLVNIFAFRENVGLFANEILHK